MQGRIRSVKKLATLVSLVLVLAAPAGAAVAKPKPKPAPPAAAPPGFPAMPQNWSHADINVTISGASHTIELDRGVVLRVSPTSLRIRRRDKTTTDVPLTRTTVVVLVGKKGKPNDGIQVGMVAWTLRVDNGPAVRVRAGYGI
jgi:hypothetical protein